MWYYKNKLNMNLCFLIVQLCGARCSNIMAEDLLNDNLGHVQFQDQLLEPIMVPNKKRLLRQYLVPFILPSKLGIRQDNRIQYKNTQKDILAEPELITEDHQETIKAKPVYNAHKVESSMRCPYGGCGLSQNSYGWSSWQYPRSYSYIPQMTPLREPCPDCNRPSSRRRADTSSEVAEEVDLEESTDKPLIRSSTHGRQHKAQQLHPNFRMESNVDQGNLDFEYDNDDSFVDHHI